MLGYRTTQKRLGHYEELMKPEDRESESVTIDQLRSMIASCMQRDRFRLRKAIQKAKSKKSFCSSDLQELQQRIEQSHKTANQRRTSLPTPQLDTELPIFERRDEIIETIRDNQVVVISGETGSGKSTQLPLIAMQMGLGVFGLIGHTQPRRIAARSVANRIASQIGTSLGQQVGFKIRFDDKTNDNTFVKLMTDGILLAETQSDRFLDQYELIIIDEAHERSLNIDFLIGNLKRILSRRRDLKVVITSATIDTERFAEHFASEQGPAPVIQVEGRTYPVETRYIPMEESESVGDDPIEHTVSTISEVVREEEGDILVFLPTEKDIKTVSKKLKGAQSAGSAIDVLPLYARLSTDQQNAIFQPGKRRRIVLATNVAESSITVPRIRIVVDSGTARISRYAPRSKVQRLPIESISQASANQRAGRCGRIGPGICVRLFSEEDFEQRPKFTTPEIRRTNLASVILQTLALNLGEITEFPFIDPPQAESISDGYRTLFEIGAIDEHRKLTKLGRWLSRLPTDPRIGRMLHAADQESCLNEILIIAAALEIQDPRVRPAEKQKQADEQHEKFKHEKSDFMSYLKLWDFFHQLRSDLSRSKFRKACQQNYLSLTLIHQWQEIHRQLKSMVQQNGLKIQKRKDDYNAIHRSLLTGFLSGIASLTDKHDYTGAGGIKFNLWPGSGVFGSKPKWIVVSELVETTRRYGRTVGKIAPEWIEPIACHLTKHNFVDPHWSKKRQTVMAYENVSLFGLPIVARRRKNYAKVDPEVSRALFIEQGIVGSQIEKKLEFLEHNQTVLSEAEQLAAKSRRRDWIVDTAILTEFYQNRLPEEAVDVAALSRLIKKDGSLNERLKLTLNDLGLDAAENPSELFPDKVNVGSMQLPVHYRFEPGSEDDGATIRIPQEALSQIDDVQSGWLVPGLNESRIAAMIKSLPKSIRRNFIPVPETAKKVMKSIEPGNGSFIHSVANQLSRIAGEPVSADMFDTEKVDNNLLINLQVLNENGELIEQGRDINELKKSIGVADDPFVEVKDTDWHADGLTTWSWGEIPDEQVVQRGVAKVNLFPAIVDQQTAVGLRLADSRDKARELTVQGLIRLFALNAKKSLRSQVNWLPDLDRHSIELGPLIKSSDLKAGLKDAISRIVVVDEQKKLPKTEAEFLSILDYRTEAISIATQKIAKWLPRLAADFHRLNLQLEKFAGKENPILDDIRMQIRSLAPDGFLATTAWTWLQHFPRYFCAAEVRCQRMSSGQMAQDLVATETVNKYWGIYQQLSEEHNSLAIVDHELTKFRWMIEEFRVSQFAQKLGTAISVSDRRLDKQLSRIKKL